MLRAELTRQPEAAHSRATAELSTLRERHAVIEVLREENRALEHRAASADESCQTVVRLEAEVEAACGARSMVRFPRLFFPCFYTLVRTLLSHLGEECGARDTRCDTRLHHAEPVGATLGTHAPS